MPQIELAELNKLTTDLRLRSITTHTVGHRRGNLT